MQTLTEQDRKDLQRAKRYAESGDEHFIPVVQYFKNGKKQPRKWFDKFRKLLLKVTNDYSIEQVHKMIGKELGITTLKRVKRNIFGCIGEATARVNYYQLQKAAENQ